MTEPDIAAIRGRHVSTEPPARVADVQLCKSDGKPWPCDAAQLLALLADTPSVEPDFDRNDCRIMGASPHDADQGALCTTHKRRWRECEAAGRLRPSVEPGQTPERRTTCGECGHATHRGSCGDCSEGVCRRATQADYDVAADYDRP